MRVFKVVIEESGKLCSTLKNRIKAGKNPAINCYVSQCWSICNILLELSRDWHHVYYYLLGALPRAVLHKAIMTLAYSSAQADMQSDVPTIEASDGQEQYYVRSS